jgi:uncharacterized protein (TIGR02266 family)
MEPLPGISAFAAVFDRATGPRLEAAERFALSLPRLFPETLVGCDFASRPRASMFVVVMRFSERRFGFDARRRLEFWCARAGVRSTALAGVTPAQRTAFFESFGRCDLKLKGVPPDRLAIDAPILFTQAGAPRDRVVQAAAAPTLSMDVGGPGWEGVRWVPGERTLFVPGVLAPPDGDELVLALRFPGVERPVEARARVVAVRGSEVAQPGAPAGFALVLLDPAPDLLGALAQHAPAPPPRPLGQEHRAHPRYAVKAPVLVTPYVEPAPGEAADEISVEVSLDDDPAPEAPSRTARIEYASDQELAADYVENLSQGGAFVRTSHPSPAGTRLTLSLRLPAGDELSATAVVAMVNEKGMGVKFELGEDAQLRLAAAIAHISARPRRVIVVDDDAVVRRMLQDAFEKRGFEVMSAADGAAGLSLLADELLALDLLVTDVNMPRMDGERFIRTIRTAGGESDLAIVVVAGSLEPGAERRLEREGADAVLDKALGPELIAQAADAVLERKRMSPPAEPRALAAVR